MALAVYLFCAGVIKLKQVKDGHSSVSLGSHITTVLLSCVNMYLPVGAVHCLVQSAAASSAGDVHTLSTWMPVVLLYMQFSWTVLTPALYYVRSGHMRRKVWVAVAGGLAQRCPSMTYGLCCFRDNLIAPIGD